MAEPTARDLHVNSLLTNMLVGWGLDKEGLVADKVMPQIRVEKESGLFAQQNRADLQRDEVRRKGDGEPSVEAGFGVTTDSEYNCEMWSLAKAWGEKTRANVDKPFSLTRDFSKFLHDQMLRHREIDFATAYLGTTIWDNDRTGVATAPVAGTSVLQWNNPSSTPIEDVADGIETIRTNTGFVPKTLVLGPLTYRRLINHPDIIARIGNVGTEARTAGAAKLQQIFDVPLVLVGSATRTTSAAGAATDVSADIVGRSALLTYAPKTVVLGEPTAGGIFTWNGLLGGNAFSGRVRSGTDMNVPKWWTAVDMAYDFVVVAPSLGFFWDGVVAAL